MPKVKLYNVAGEAAGEIELNDSVFGVDYNEAVIHQAVVRQMANERLGTHATKTRGLVRGPTVGRRWYRIRTDPEKPCQRHAEKSTSAGCKICTV